MLTSSKEMIKYQADINSALAKENRDWQERLANSAHQREIADLKAAGLNPVLTVSGGSGANTPSGSTAQASDGSGYYSALLNLKAAQINSAASVKIARMNNATQIFTHTTPSASTVPGIIDYYGEHTTGNDLSDVLKAAGQTFGIGAVSADGVLKVGAKTKPQSNAIIDSFNSIVDDMATAKVNGKTGKYKRLQRKLDRMAYFYPEEYAQWSGSYLEYINRKNDYSGKNWRSYRKIRRNEK